MPVLNRIADFAPEMAKWRHHLHSHPELEFDCHATAAFVADQLRAFGVDEIHQGIAQSGLVAIINGQGAGPTLGLRADMDALPISEMTGAAHASTKTGVMHACDGGVEAHSVDIGSLHSHWHTHPFDSVLVASPLRERSI